MSAAPPQDFMTLADIFGALRSRWFGILATACFLTMLVVVVLMLIPNSYQSDALLYVRMGRGTVSLDPASTAASQTISLMDRRQSEINSVREMLQSRVVLDRAVRQVGVDRVLEHDAWWNEAIDGASQWFETKVNSLQDKFLKQRLINSEKAPAGFTTDEFKAQEDLELAVKRLFKALTIDAAKESYTLGVTVRAYEPELAQALCEAIISEYRKVHVDAHSMEGSLQFFETEYELSQSRLAEMESRLRDEKNRTSLMTVTGKQELIHQEIRQLQADRIKAGTELAAAQGRDAEIARKISNIPANLDIEKTAGVGNAATDAMRNQLFELEMMEKELMGKYAPDHPLVMQVRTKLKEAKVIYNGQSEDRVLSKQALNPIRQELELDRLRNLSALEGWRAQMEEINDKLTLAQEKASQLNNDELNINELERNVQLARNDVLTYGRKREEARLLKQLDVGNFSDISVPQPPMLVFKHVAPKRSLLLALGAAGSLVVSCCLAVWKGPRKRKRQTPAPQESKFNDAQASESAVASPSKSLPKKAPAVALQEVAKSEVAHLEKKVDAEVSPYNTRAFGH
ncbi:MAG: hypothetical protein IT423_16575, partial [Pirellulaceae bacterium]|nr:hypothetical protein [Pirellulaceae bacterium]